MKKVLLIPATAVFLLIHTLVLAEVQTPHQVGGFVLGSKIGDYKELVKLETAMPVRDMKYIEEVEVRKMKDFKSGLISYGLCAAPGRIVRIKLKYAYPTKKFYEALLKRFKKRFGEPHEWRGDPFHIVIAWKWGFVDKEGNRVGLILQHNTKDTEHKMGNSVKIKMTNFWEEERDCFEKRQREDHEAMRKKRFAKKRKGPVNWESLIPR